MLDPSRISFLFMFIAAATGLLLAWKGWSRVGWKSCAFYCIMRYALVCWCMQHFAIGPWGDAIGWNMHGGWMVNDGLFPGKGFCTPYYLGFNAMLAGATWLWNNPASVAAVFALAELLAVFVLFHALRRVFDLCSAKRAIILYLTSPVSVFCGFATQDETLIFLGVSAVLYFSVRNRIFFKYVSLFLTFAFTKILAPIYIIAFFIWHRWKGLILFGLCLAAYWAVSYSIGVDPFDIRFGREIGMNPSYYDRPVENPLRGNVWYFLPHASLVVKCLVLFPVLTLAGLCFVPTFFSETFDLKAKCQAGIVLTVIVFFLFQLLYPMVYHGYMIPVVAFCYVLFLQLDIGRLKKVSFFAFFIAWQVLFLCKDGDSRIISFFDPTRMISQGVVMMGSVSFIIAIFLLKGNIVSSPFCGIASLFGGKSRT